VIARSVQYLRRRLLPKTAVDQTHDVRATHRSRRAALSGGMATLARIVQVGSSLITVPLTLHYLGNERFGLWMTISSVLAMAAFADFGLGNGVLNTIAHAHGKDDAETIRSTISSGMAVLSLIAGSILVVFLSLYRFVSWGDVFRVTSPQARLEAGPALIVFVVCFALNIPLDLVQRVQLGLQQGYRNGLWQLCGSAAGLIGIVLGIALHVSLPILVIAIAGGPLVSTALNTLYFFGVDRPEFRPKSALISREMIVRIANLGGLFFMLQLVVALAFSADNFIVARTLGAVAVPQYSIPQRMFSIIPMLVAMLVSGLWPAYGEAISRGDIPWVRRTLTRSMLGVLAMSSAASVTVLLLSRHLLKWWIGPRVQPPFILLLGLAIWVVMECCGSTFSMFLNGATVMRFQIIVASAFGLGCVTAKVLLIRRFGVVALPWATILSYGLLNALPYAFFIGKALHQLEAKTWVASALSSKA
jgi:O-antigen/teichoic acid export membrane protein